jgi:hypothetical protein
MEQMSYCLKCFAKLIFKLPFFIDERPNTEEAVFIPKKRQLILKKRQLII